MARQISPSLSYSAVPGIPLIEPGDDLVELVASALRRAEIVVNRGDIFVFAQKVISKAENRYVDLATITASNSAREIAQAVGKDPRYVEVVLSESEEVLRQRPGILITSHRLGFVAANAGIDESNIQQLDGSERVLLLPRNPDASAANLKAGLDKAFQTQTGVIIIDSFGRAWRNGVVGFALGAAGIPSLVDVVGEPDLFGRIMRVTKVAVADQLAAAASLLMGETAEGRPVVLVKGFTSTAPDQPASTLIRDRKQDLFR